MVCIVPILAETLLPAPKRGVGGIIVRNGLKCGNDSLILIFDMIKIFLAVSRTSSLERASTSAMSGSSLVSFPYLSESSGERLKISSPLSEDRDSTSHSLNDLGLYSNTESDSDILDTKESKSKILLSIR